MWSVKSYYTFTNLHLQFTSHIFRENSFPSISFFVAFKAIFHVFRNIFSLSVFLVSNLCLLFHEHIFFHPFSFRHRHNWMYALMLIYFALLCMKWINVWFAQICTSNNLICRQFVKSSLQCNEFRRSMCKSFDWIILYDGFTVSIRNGFSFCLPSRFEFHLQSKHIQFFLFFC